MSRWLPVKKLNEGWRLREKGRGILSTAGSIDVILSLSQSKMQRTPSSVVNCASSRMISTSKNTTSNLDLKNLTQQHSNVKLVGKNTS